MVSSQGTARPALLRQAPATRLSESSRASTLTSTWWSRYLRLLSLAVALVVSVGLSPLPQASAATGDVGIQGASYSGVTAPTGEKPESKLWFNDGRWWSVMFDTPSGTWRIFYLNRSASPEVWVNTGTVVDTRANTLSDALSTGSTLYVASHVKATSNTSVATNQPARLYRYSYNAAAKTYALDSGFPTNINNTSSETLTIDRDSAGLLWATWTEQTSVFIKVKLKR
jgi:hypothetical protein